MVSKEDIYDMAYKLFDDYDKDNSGYLDRSELTDIFNTLFKQINQKIDCSQQKINKMFAACDTNSDNKLTRKQFKTVLGLFLEPVYL